MDFSFTTVCCIGNWKEAHLFKLALLHSFIQQNLLECHESLIPGDLPALLSYNPSDLQDISISIWGLISVVAARGSQLVKPPVAKNKNRECEEVDLSVTEGENPVTEVSRVVSEEVFGLRF